MLDISCIGIPAFGQSGPFIAPYDLRAPSRNFHDLTVFKDFRFGRASKRMQIRAGVFNLFNQAYPIAPAGPGGTDIDLRSRPTATARVNGVPNGEGGFADNVCDPTGGYTFTAEHASTTSARSSPSAAGASSSSPSGCSSRASGRLERGASGPPFFSLRAL